MFEALSAMKKLPASPLAQAVDAVMRTAHLAVLDAKEPFYAIQGMSGKRYRFFINRLVKSFPGVGYLEVGSWQGSTLCSAISDNMVRAVAIDNWSEFGGPRDAFFANVKAFANERNAITVIESDFHFVNYSSLGPPCQIYLFDGPHDAKEQYDGLALALPALAEEFVFIVDDWNWERVRQGTFSAIRDLGLAVEYAIELRTTLDDSHPKVAFGDSDWHNGYYVSVLRKTSPDDPARAAIPASEAA